MVFDSRLFWRHGSVPIEELKPQLFVAWLLEVIKNTAVRQRSLIYCESWWMFQPLSLIWVKSVHTLGDYWGLIHLLGAFSTGPNVFTFPWKQWSVSTYEATERTGLISLQGETAEAHCNMNPDSNIKNTCLRGVLLHSVTMCSYWPHRDPKGTGIHQDLTTQYSHIRVCTASMDLCCTNI